MLIYMGRTLNTSTLWRSHKEACQSTGWPMEGWSGPLPWLPALPLALPQSASTLSAPELILLLTLPYITTFKNICLLIHISSYVLDSLNQGQLWLTLYSSGSGPAPINSLVGQVASMWERPEVEHFHYHRKHYWVVLTFGLVIDNSVHVLSRRILLFENI